MAERVLIFPGGIKASIYAEFKPKSDSVEFTGHFTKDSLNDSKKFKVEMTTSRNQIDKTYVSEETLTFEVADLMYEQLLNELFSEGLQPTIVPKRQGAFS